KVQSRHRAKMAGKRMGLNSAWGWMSIASSRSPRILRHFKKLVTLPANRRLPAASKLGFSTASPFSGDYGREPLPICAADGEGDADRALRYYELSSQKHSQAIIDQASRPELKGRPFEEAFASLQVPELQSNKANLQAISLLGKWRIVEAEAVLKQALAGDPHNPFTLNNMGYVMEQEGDLESALRYYSSAA